MNLDFSPPVTAVLREQADNVRIVVFSRVESKYDEMYAHRCRGRNRSLWGTVDTRLSPGVIAPCGWRTHLNYAAKCRAQNGQPTLGLNEAEQRSEHGLSSAAMRMLIST